MLQRRPAVESDYQFMWDLHLRTLRSYVEATWAGTKNGSPSTFAKRATCHAMRSLSITGGISDVLESGMKKTRCCFSNMSPFFRSIRIKGLGSEVVRDVLRSAAERGVPVRLSVLKVNPVRKLYERMGFPTIGSDEFRYYMEAVPDAG